MSRPEILKLNLEAESPRYEKHWQTLSAAERERASRYRRADDRLRFVVARGSLREELGRRLDMPAPEVTFVTGPHGKPALPDPPALHFNTTHSGAWVVHAFDDAPIGVDVERLDPGHADIDAWRSVLADDELQRLSAIGDAAARAMAFTKLWVRKEAYLKALGDGLNRPAQGINIAEDERGHPCLRHDRHAHGSAVPWTFADIEIDDAHVACVVYRTAQVASLAR